MDTGFPTKEGAFSEVEKWGWNGSTRQPAVIFKHEADMLYVRWNDTVARGYTHTNSASFPPRTTDDKRLVRNENTRRSSMTSKCPLKSLIDIRNWF